MTKEAPDLAWFSLWLRSDRHGDQVTRPIAYKCGISAAGSRFFRIRTVAGLKGQQSPPADLRTVPAANSGGLARVLQHRISWTAWRLQYWPSPSVLFAEKFASLNKPRQDRNTAVPGRTDQRCDLPGKFRSKNHRNHRQSAVPTMDQGEFRLPGDPLNPFPETGRPRPWS
jgi:hypothetical protein